MENKSKIRKMTLSKQGEILLILVKRDGRNADDIAEAMGIDKSYLSKLYKMDRLPRKPLEKARTAFPEAELYLTEFGEKRSLVEEPTSAYRASGSPKNPDTAQLMEEIAAIRTEIARLNQELEQQKAVNVNLAEAILNMSKRS
jgi:transcriptional regulator with XRE-family HTH domain